MTDATPQPIKLNIGAGTTHIDGFTPIDRRHGSEAYPLDQYDDNSVEEIRASHVLEHFGFAEVQLVVNEWARVLKHGGIMRLAVPDFDKLKVSDDPKVPLYLMGGQTDANDFHRSVFTLDILGGFMERAGLGEIGRWSDNGTDTASHPISLNLMGRKVCEPVEIPQRKPKPGETTMKLCAVMSVPALGHNEAFSCVYQALGPLGIPVHQFTGAFWGQCMTRGLEDCQRKRIDWCLTIDYDSMFTPGNVRELIDIAASRPDIDAIAALQCRRGTLVAIGDVGGIDKTMRTDGSPIKVVSAHFGLTLIRIAALADLEKPWIHGIPDPNGGWNNGRTDDDIAFWRRWEAAGKTCYIAPSCAIGHLEQMVGCFDERLQVQHLYPKDWRRQAYPHRYPAYNTTLACDRIPDDGHPGAADPGDALTPPPPIWVDSETGDRSVA